MFLKLFRCFGSRAQNQSFVLPTNQWHAANALDCFCFLNNQSKHWLHYLLNAGAGCFTWIVPLVIHRTILLGKNLHYIWGNWGLVKLMLVVGGARTRNLTSDPKFRFLTTIISMRVRVRMEWKAYRIEITLGNSFSSIPLGQEVRTHAEIQRHNSWSKPSRHKSDAISVFMKVFYIFNLSL